MSMDLIHLIQGNLLVEESFSKNIFDRFDEELIHRTIGTWQDKFAHTISNEEARLILTVLADLAENLAGWSVDAVTNDAIAEKRAS